VRGFCVFSNGDLTDGFFRNVAVVVFGIPNTLRRRPQTEKHSMETAEAPALPTVGQIAQRLGVPVHRISYVIDSRGIKPVGWAGNAKVFDEPAVQRIGSELKRIAEDKEANTW
jgi:hypothetical protein